MYELSEAELSRRAVASELLEVRTSVAAVLDSYDPVTNFAIVKAAVRKQITDPDTARVKVLEPCEIECPVMFPNFGDSVIYHPLKAGTIGRLEFSEEDDFRVYLEASTQLPTNPSILGRHSVSAVFRPEGSRGGLLQGENADRGFIGRPGGVGISWNSADLRLGGSDASDGVVRKSDLQAVINYITGHTHPESSGGVTSAPAVPPSAATASLKVRSK